MTGASGTAPLVSICIPTYNGAEYLEACLDSVLNQTFTDFEVLIVDDCSSDASVEIARRYAGRDPRFRVTVNQKNLGLVGNWNHSVLLADGEWIKFLFQDDLLEPTCLEKMLAAARPDTSMVVCKREILLEEASQQKQSEFMWFIREYNMDRLFDGERDISPELFSRTVLNNWLINFVGEPTAVLLRRSVFCRFGFFNPQLIQICDFEYWIRVASNVGFVYVPEQLATFRCHGGSTSSLNVNTRRFRTYLDELICYHECIFNPLYRSFRRCAAQSRPPVNLEQWFASWVQKAIKDARANPEAGLLKEMKELMQLYPGFGIVKKIPFSLSFSKYKWKIRSHFSSLGGC